MTFVQLTCVMISDRGRRRSPDIDQMSVWRLPLVDSRENDYHVVSPSPLLRARLKRGHDSAVKGFMREEGWGSGGGFTAEARSRSFECNAIAIPVCSPAPVAAGGGGDYSLTVCHRRDALPRKTRGCASCAKDFTLITEELNWVALTKILLRSENLVGSRTIQNWQV